MQNVFNIRNGLRMMRQIQFLRFYLHLDNIFNLILVKLATISIILCHYNLYLAPTLYRVETFHSVLLNAQRIFAVYLFHNIIQIRYLLSSQIFTCFIKRKKYYLISIL